MPFSLLIHLAAAASVGASGGEFALNAPAITIGSAASAGGQTILVSNINPTGSTSAGGDFEVRGVFPTTAPETDPQPEALFRSGFEAATKARTIQP